MIKNFFNILLLMIIVLSIHVTAQDDNPFEQEEKTEDDNPFEKEDKPKKGDEKPKKGNDDFEHPHRPVFDKQLIADVKAIKTMQNKSASWGDKNDIHCSAFTLLALSHHQKLLYYHCDGMLHFGIMWFRNYAGDVPPKLKPLHSQALSFSYKLTEANKIKIKAQNALNAVLKNWISVSDFKETPREYYLQARAVKAATLAGIEVDTKRIEAEIKNLKDGSFYAVACKHLWGHKTNISEVHLKKANDSLYKSTSIIDDLVLSDYLKDHLPNAAKIIQKKFSNKDFNYTVDPKVFSPKEIKLLNLVYPLLIRGVFTAGNK